MDLTGGPSITRALVAVGLIAVGVMVAERGARGEVWRLGASRRALRPQRASLVVADNELRRVEVGRCRVRWT